jgi:hypothetical protein
VVTLGRYVSDVVWFGEYAEAFCQGVPAGD